MGKGVFRLLALGAIAVACAGAQATPTPYSVRSFSFEAGVAGSPSAVEFHDHFNNGDPLTGAMKVVGGVSSPAAVAYLNAGFSSGAETLPSDWVATAHDRGRLSLQAQDAVDTGPNSLTQPGLTVFQNRLTAADVAGNPLLARTQSFDVHAFWDFTVPDANSYYGLRLSDNPGGGADYNDLLDLRVTLGGDGRTKLQLRRLTLTGGQLAHESLALFDVQNALGAVPISQVAYVGFDFHYHAPGNALSARIDLVDATGNDLKVFDNMGGFAIFRGEDFTRASVGAVWQLAPVPEPGSWALMLGGLAAFGLLARRRGGAA